MKKILWTAALGALTTGLYSTTAFSNNLGQFDARSLALGGAGVASANSANAAAHNPALLAAPKNKKRFSMLFPVIKVTAINENDFIDKIEDAEDLVTNDSTGLNKQLDGLDGLSVSGACSSAETTCYANPSMAPAALKANELFEVVTDLNNSAAVINAGVGLALTAGKNKPVAVIIDGGLSIKASLKVAESDFTELKAYSTVLSDGIVTRGELTELVNQGLATGGAGSSLQFQRGSGSGDNSELNSLVELVGAKYETISLSFADSFNYRGTDLSVGISPKLVNVEALKFHQSASTKDIDSDKVRDSVKSYTDINLDAGLLFKPYANQPLMVGLTLKNLFKRTYKLNETDLEKSYKAQAAGGSSKITNDDISKFNFDDDIAIEPQLTAGIEYSLKVLKVVADLDLNEAEILGRTNQYLALGTELDLKFFRFELGYRASIGGDKEENSASVGLGLGPVHLAAMGSKDNLGAILQTGFSF